MLFFDGALGLIVTALWIFCVIDVITTPESSVRNLPKLVWVFIVILLFDIGAILWLIAGRDWNRSPRGLPYKGNQGEWGTAPAPRMTASRASNPDDDEDFQARLRARVDEQRRRAREGNGDGKPSGDSSA